MHFTAAPSSLHSNGAALLPKLRAEFAEFLNEPSLEHLWTLILVYLCRFEVRFLDFSLEVFLGSVESAASNQLIVLCASLLSPGGFAYQDQLTRIEPSMPGPAYPSASPHRQTKP